jgi:hypothetical protein
VYEIDGLIVTVDSLLLTYNNATFAEWQLEIYQNLYEFRKFCKFCDVFVTVFGKFKRATPRTDNPLRLSGPTMVVRPQRGQPQGIVRTREEEPATFAGGGTCNL